MEFRILGPLEVIADGRPSNSAGRSSARYWLCCCCMRTGRLQRSADRGAVGGRAAGNGPEGAPGPRSQLREAARPGASGDEAAGLPAPGRAGRARPRRFERLERRRAGQAGRGARAVARPAARRLRATSASPRPRSPAWRSCGSPASRSASSATWQRAGTPSWSGELEALVARAPAAGAPPRPADARALPLGPPGRGARRLPGRARARSSTSSGSSPAGSCASSTRRSSKQDPALDRRRRGRRLTPERRAGAASSVARRELAELIAGLDDAFAGRGRPVPARRRARHRQEPAGRGAAPDARARGARVLVGRCWEAGGAPAYWPWVQSLRAYVREAEPAALRAQLGAGAVELAQLLPELRELVPDLPEPPAIEPESARFRLFDAVAAFLAAPPGRGRSCSSSTTSTPPTSRRCLLLRFLARELGDSRVLVVGAYRDVDPTPERSADGGAGRAGPRAATRRSALCGLDARATSRSFIELVAGRGAERRTRR